MTIDQLYASCRRDVLATHPALPVRMHFDRVGFLQHCGFALQDCDDCAAVSIQSVAKSDTPADRDLRRNLCINYDGFAFARNDASWSFGCGRCTCEPGAEFPRQKPASREPPPEDTADARSSGLADICDIDPAACPSAPPDGPWGSWGSWSCMTLLMADCEAPPSPPSVRAPICVGKATPTESNAVAGKRCRRAEAEGWAALQQVAR